MPSTAIQSFEDPYRQVDYAVGNTPFVGAYDSETNSWIKAPSAIEKMSDMLGFTNYQGDYDAKLANNERLYERANIESARAWEEYLSSTQYQRAKADLEAAGMNPWLALQSGVSGSSQSSSTDTGGSTGKLASNRKDTTRNALAAFLIAFAKLIA